MLGISTLTTFGINAAMFGMVAHGLITGMLFFIAGSVKHRYHTLAISDLKGMLVSMPRLGWILGFCAMASLGLPGLAGFWGEFPAILSTYNPLEAADLSRPLFRTLMVIAAFGTVLAASYLLWLYQRTAFGTPDGHEVDGHGHGAHDDHDASSSGHDTHVTPAGAVGAAVNPHDDDEHHDDLHDVTVIEWISWLPILALIVALGVYPQLLFKVLDPAVDGVVSRLTEYFTP
jgi:NADH-quinone oxidoreductase subunit M